MKKKEIKAWIVVFKGEKATCDYIHKTKNRAKQFLNKVEGDIYPCIITYTT